MRHILIFCSLLAIAATSADAARCTGSSSCRACTTCSSCKHCAKQGGSCGVCSSGLSSEAASEYREQPRTTERSRPRISLPPSLPTPSPAAEPESISPSPAKPDTVLPPGALDASQASIAVFFSPHGGCEQAIVKTIEQATTRVRIQAYYFTNSTISLAVRKAHQRGIETTILLDSSQRSTKYSSADYFANDGIDTRIDSEHKIAHSKIILIDDHTIITGSFNFTNAAEDSNEENLLVIRNMPELFAKYVEHFDQHLAHSAAYAGKLQSELQER